MIGATKRDMEWLSSCTSLANSPSFAWMQKPLPWTPDDRSCAPFRFRGSACRWDEIKKKCTYAIGTNRNARLSRVESWVKAQ